MVAQADACLAAGAKVAVGHDIGSGHCRSRSRRSSRRRAAWSIDYDRQVVGGIAKVYVAFDGKAASAQPRPTASSRPNARASTKPVVAELWGGPTDQNAFWFQSGNNDILNPLFKTEADEGPAAVRPGWLATNAAPIFEQMLAQDEQQDRRRHRGERQHRRRRDRDPEGKHLKPIPLSGQDATPRACRTSSRAGRR